MNKTLAKKPRASRAHSNNRDDGTRVARRPGRTRPWRWSAAGVAAVEVVGESAAGAAVVEAAAGVAVVEVVGESAARVAVVEAVGDSAVKGVGVSAVEGVAAVASRPATDEGTLDRGGRRRP